LLFLICPINDIVFPFVHAVTVTENIKTALITQRTFVLPFENKRSEMRIKGEVRSLYERNG
jgi:hypothetical protein